MTRRTLLALLACGVLLLSGCAAVIGGTSDRVRVPWPGPSGRVEGVVLDGGQPLLLASSATGEAQTRQAAFTVDVCSLGGEELLVDEVRLAASSGSVALDGVWVDSQLRPSPPVREPSRGAARWEPGKPVTFRDCGAPTRSGRRMVVQVTGRAGVGGSVLGIGVRYRDLLGNTYEQVIPANLVLCGVMAGTSCQPASYGPLQPGDADADRVKHVTSEESVAVQLPLVCSWTGVPVELVSVSAAGDLGNTRLDRVEAYDGDLGYAVETRPRPVRPGVEYPEVRFTLCPGYRQLAPGAPTVVVGPSLPLVPVDPGPQRRVVVQLSRVDGSRGGGWDGVRLTYREEGQTYELVLPVSVVFCGSGTERCGGRG